VSARIERFDAATAPEAELEAHYDLDREIHLEWWAEDPLPPYDLWRKAVLEPVSWRRPERWVVWDEARTRILAAASFVAESLETNRHLAEADVSVRAEARRRGLGREIKGPIAERARAEARTVVTGGTVSDSAGARFAEAIGAEAKSTERMSRLRIDRVDRVQLEEWVVRAKERAEGFSLLRWDGRVPDEYLERYLRLTEVMNTAPRDDLDVEDWVATPERHRERERLTAERGFEWWTVVVRHDETDQLAGYTEFLFPPHDRTSASQEATAVDPTYRNKGIGRWLKAANLLRLLDEKPDVTHVDTWNAFSNGPMLGINIAMGFELIKSFTAYQVPTERL
jgi:GNAT superfamily N-acetyltransferase